MRRLLQPATTGHLVRYLPRCWIRHKWRTYQHCVPTIDEVRPVILVIAFKVCERCAKSKLIHILQ